MCSKPLPLTFVTPEIFFVPDFFLLVGRAMNHLANLPDAIVLHIYSFVFDDVLEEIRCGHIYLLLYCRRLWLRRWCVPYNRLHGNDKDYSSRHRNEDLWALGFSPETLSGFPFLE